MASMTSSLTHDQPSRERDELSRKLQTSLQHNAILAKELNQWKREHGDLLLRERSTEDKLNDAIVELQALRLKLAQASSMAELEIENRLLKQERNEMEKRIEAARKEADIARKQYGEMSREMEEEMAKRGKEIERREKEVVEERERSGRLKREKESVIVAATRKFDELEVRMRKLEMDVEILTGFNHHHHDQGLAATDPGPQPEQQELGSQSASETRPIRDASAPPPVFDISDSDDDGELPSSKGIKRGLFSSGVSLEQEKNGAESEDNSSKRLRGPNCESAIRPPSVAKLGSDQARMKVIGKPKQDLTALKQCENKHDLGVGSDGKLAGLESRSDCRGDREDESSGSNKEWEYEADMLEALERDAELCVKGVCALYRHQKFNSSGALRGIYFGKFLVNGDPSRMMRRTLADLEKFEPNSAVECKRIAFGHSKQLFDIYRNKKDPHFGP